MTLEGLGEPLVGIPGAHSEAGSPRQPARPCRQMGPRVALAKASWLGEARAPLLGSLALGLGSEPWLGGRHSGAWPGGRGRGFPLSGDLRLTAVTRRAPLLSPSREAGLSLRPGGVGRVGLLSPGLAPGFPPRNLVEAPPSVPRPPIVSAIPSLSARVAPFPCPRPGSASALLPWALHLVLPGFQGGCPGGVARQEGGGERPASPALPASGESGERAASSAREEGSPPPGPSGAFCSQAEVCMPGP